MISINNFVQIVTNAIDNFTKANVKEGTEIPKFNISLVSFDIVGEVIKGKFYTSLNDNMMYEAVFVDNKLQLNPYKEFKPVVFDIISDAPKNEKIEINDSESKDTTDVEDIAEETIESEE